MAIRMSGLSSGLDTESIVSALVSSYSEKTNKYKKAQTKVSWKQDAWKSVNSEVYSLYQKASSLRFTSAYSTKKATVSDATKATVSASSNAANVSQSLEITQLASAGYITGGKIKKKDSSDSSKVTGATKLSELMDISGDGTIAVTTGGKTTNISVNKDTTVNSFVNSLKDAGLQANFDSSSGRIYVNAKKSGADNDFSLTGADSTGLSAMKALGIATSSTADLSYYQKLASYNVSGDKDATIDNIKSVLEKYRNAVTDNTTQNSNITTYNQKKTYANAYAAVKDAENSATTNGKDLSKLEEYLALAEKNSGTVYIDDNGTIYDKVEETKDDDGNTTYKYSSSTDDTKTKTTESKLSTLSDKINEEAKNAGLLSDDGKDNGLATFKTNYSKFVKFANDSSMGDFFKSVESDYSINGNVDATVSDLDTKISDAEKQINTNNTYISDNKILGSKITDTQTLEALAASLYDSVSTAADVVENPSNYVSDGATKVNGADSKIKLNGVEYTSSSNAITVNGLTINALAKTDTDKPITVTTQTDSQGLYDKIKDFLSDYNDVINDLTKLYNADSSKGYEPLTDEEKDKMSDTEVEKWEKKIKDSLLRRDTTLNDVMSTMTNSMAKSFKYTDSNGNTKTLSLSSFGISTLGILGSEKNEYNAYHIDGDADDTDTSSKTDKLLAAITEDPDSVVNFFKDLTSGLYTSLDKKMKSTTLRSAYTIYNDKELKKEYDNYSDLISTWETRLSDMEDSYYKKFSKMESALATLQSNSTSLSNMMG